MSSIVSFAEWPVNLYTHTGSMCHGLVKHYMFLCRLGSLTFKAPDCVKYPSMDLAYSAGRAGGTMTGVLSAANEKVVELFIDERCVSLLIYFASLILGLESMHADHKTNSFEKFICKDF